MYNKRTIADLTADLDAVRLALFESDTAHAASKKQAASLAKSLEDARAAQLESTAAASKAAEAAATAKSEAEETARVLTQLGQELETARAAESSGKHHVESLTKTLDETRLALFETDVDSKQVRGVGLDVLYDTVPYPTIPTLPYRLYSALPTVPYPTLPYSTWRG